MQHLVPLETPRLTTLHYNRNNTAPIQTKATTLGFVFTKLNEFTDLNPFLNQVEQLELTFLSNIKYDSSVVKPNRRAGRGRPKLQHSPITALSNVKEIDYLLIGPRQCELKYVDQILAVPELMQLASNAEKINLSGFYTYTNRQPIRGQVSTSQLLELKVEGILDVVEVQWIVNCAAQLRRLELVDLISYQTA